MDITFVEQAEHDIDDDQCCRNQVRLASKRALEGLRSSLESTAYGRWRANTGNGALYGFDRLAESGARRQIEGDGNGRELSLMADRQEVCFGIVYFDKSSERNLFAAHR